MNKQTINLIVCAIMGILIMTMIHSTRQEKYGDGDFNKTYQQDLFRGMARPVWEDSKKTKQVAVPFTRGDDKPPKTQHGFYSYPQSEIIGTELVKFKKNAKRDVCARYCKYAEHPQIFNAPCAGYAFTPANKGGCVLYKPGAKRVPWSGKQQWTAYMKEDADDVGLKTASRWGNSKRNRWETSATVDPAGVMASRENMKLKCGKRCEDNTNCNMFSMGGGKDKQWCQMFEKKGSRYREGGKWRSDSIAYPAPQPGRFAGEAQAIDGPVSYLKT